MELLPNRNFYKLNNPFKFKKKKKKMATNIKLSMDELNRKSVEEFKENAIVKRLYLGGGR